MNDNELFREVDGEPMLAPKGMSLLLGVPLADILAESARHDGQPWTLPAEWIKSGIRRSKEYAAATGRNDMHGALEYWAAKESK